MVLQVASFEAVMLEEGAIAVSQPISLAEPIHVQLSNEGLQLAMSKVGRKNSVLEFGSVLNLYFLPIITPGYYLSELLSLH